jgi:hypothetical protein
MLPLPTDPLSEPPPDEGKKVVLRERLIQRTKKLLVRKSNPRLQMFFILLLSGLGAFFSSWLMLQMGLATMAIRYPLAVAFGYLVFLLLLWLWLYYTTTRTPVSNLEPSHNPVYYYDPIYYEPGPSPTGPTASAGVAGTKSEGGRLSLNLGDADGEGAALVVIILIVVAVVVGIVSIIIIATGPTLLAELLVDGVLLTGMSQRTGYVQGPHWLSSVLGRTLPWAIVLILVFGFAGWALESLMPGAHTMGQIFHRLG